jgi:hemoglobin
MSEKSLYDRLGGYDAISAVTLSMLDRMEKDPQLSRFWAHRSIDGVKRERQFIVDFMVASTGGPLYYAGRDMVLSHRGMRINQEDWEIFLGHADAALKEFHVPDAEYDEVVAFVQSTKGDIVEA